MISGKVNTFVWLHKWQGDELRRIARENAAAEAAWVDAERARLGLALDAPTPQAVRLEALALRPGTWPGASHLVEASMRVRLAAPDLAGPWAPFRPSEQEAQRLAGRRPGTPNEQFTDKIAVDIAPDLIASAQLAAYRVSEPVVAQLHAENLIGSGASRSRAARARRAELQAQIYTVGRIAREAITRLILS
ncbi:hypothetical protein HW130_32235 [Streptomyces sp. PKU-EA00015]|uniref:hypothetical protein n=1 Tax=Streptomyces sp. PKU-EA00015 TaxID=2748326 RepID=UPI0015A281B5|nr:hypothetical protein [Streptomyces sp. PKU-EA00015]NWF30862.1 hypothetical protein [Streptomyces sp. PKU-EA00015]